MKGGSLHRRDEPEDIDNRVGYSGVVGATTYYAAIG